jgi:flagellar biosynthetic protein FliR
MPVSLTFDQQLTGFILTLSRVSATLLLLPMPGFQYVSQQARIVLIMGVTFCLLPVWQQVAAADAALGLWVAVLVECTIGLMIGLTIAFLFESFQLGAQIISTQAGFGFATTIDPQTQADSNVLQIFTQLTAGLIFFALGIHHQLIRMLSHSFAAFALDNDHARNLSVNLILHLGSRMFVDGFKLALPIVVLLFLVDQGLAAITRLQAQLQLLTLAFPVKILLSILFLGVVLTRWPGIFGRLAAASLTYVMRMFAAA